MGLRRSVRAAASAAAAAATVRVVVLASAVAAVLGAGAVAAGAARAEGDPTPSSYRDFSVTDNGFRGPGRDLAAPTGLTSVRIGVLAPAGREEGERLREGVALAVAEANAAGGYGGVPYEIVFRPDDGPWGMGAKQATALAYEDSSWVILGGLEGADAHLAELVAAKLWIPVVTPTAGDLSIDYANVPWVFRCFPSDDRQAAMLLAWAESHACSRIVVFAGDDREGKTGSRRLAAAAASTTVELLGPRAFRAHVAPSSVDSEELAGADAAVIWASADAARAMLRALRDSGFGGPVLAPATFPDPDGLPGDPGELVVAAGLAPGRDDPVWRAFAEAYELRYGRSPDAVSAYSYDAACLALAAIGRAGLNRVRIREELAATSHEGVAGTYRFDGLGGASLEPVLVVRPTGGGRSRGEVGAD